MYSQWNLTKRYPAFTLTFLCFCFQLPSEHRQRPAGILRCSHTFPAAYVDVQKPPPGPLLRTQMYHLYKSCQNTTCLQPIYCRRCGSFSWQDIRRKVTIASGSSLEGPSQLALTLSRMKICIQSILNDPTAKEEAAVPKGKQLSVYISLADLCKGALHHTHYPVLLIASVLFTSASQHTFCVTCFLTKLKRSTVFMFLFKT